MASQWGGNAVNMDAEIGPCQPPPTSEYKPQSFPMTRTSYSYSGTSWADCGHSTTTSSSGSRWPISSAGLWSNPNPGQWGSPQPRNSSGDTQINQWSNSTPTQFQRNTGDTEINHWSNTQATQLPRTSGAGDWGDTSSLSRDAREDDVQWPSGPPINRWQDSDVNTTAEIHAEDDDNEDEMMDDDNQKDSCNDVTYASPISRKEYDKQSEEYTKQAVAQLIASPEYQKKHTTCELCWSVWAEGQVREGCEECGGFAMQRPCAICDGRCDAVWTRDVSLSHSEHEAQWLGECRLPWKQRQGFLAQKLLDKPLSDEQLVEDFSELKSS